MSDYEQKLAEWKLRRGIDPKRDVNHDELRMMSEESASRGMDWCLGCDKKMPVSEMKLITRAVDPYVQIDEKGGDYITPRNRVRMCPQCYKDEYESE